MSTGASIGWFDPRGVVPDVDYFVRRLSHTIGPAKLAWPLEVRTIKGTPLSYAKVDNHIPIHIDNEADEADRLGTSMFHFVFHTENRPVLLVGHAGDAATDTSTPNGEMAVRRSESLLMGAEVTKSKPFNIGCIELCAGMAVHFDIADNWHGISAAPVPMRNIGMRQDPKAIIVQMAGYGPDKIDEAFHDMARLLQLDRGYWDSGRRDRAGRKA